MTAKQNIAFLALKTAVLKRQALMNQYGRMTIIFSDGQQLAKDRLHDKIVNKTYSVATAAEKFIESHE